MDFENTKRGKTMGQVDVLSYCVKCRKKTPMVDRVEVKMKNGRPAARGKCDVCGTAVYMILKAGATV